MSAQAARLPTPGLVIRPAERADIGSLLELETVVFSYDRLSRRSFLHFLTAPGASLIVAEQQGGVTGYALTLFRPRSLAGRLYSIAVAPAHARQGTGAALLAVAEDIAMARGCKEMRLEVHSGNGIAIACYRAAGYQEFAQRSGYYQDGGDALRFHKPLYPPRRAA